MGGSGERTSTVAAVAAVAVGVWLLYSSRWVVTSSVSGERDSHPLVYVVYGSVTWLPGLLLVTWGVWALARRDRQP